MAKKVTAIPATKNRFTSVPVTEVKKRKTAGYARVSTDREEQATSYEAQMDYYKNYISSRPDWEFVGMYSDEGISATNTKHRAGFNQMIEDALAGKIDLIITKSVSRFARNTVDSLQNVRKLKERGVEIYFEKENIWTLDAKGELLITIMSSLAQEESRSISENTTWGKRKQFADGVVSIGYSTFLGYDKDFKINPEQAETVKLIYKLFLSGLSAYAIARELEKRGIAAPAGGKKWYTSSVKSILTNEKYKGDALLQKEFTVDFLEKTKKKNEGEVPQYYVEGHHEAIISPSVFEQVQIEFARREKMGRYSGVTIFSNKIQCGCCGAWFGSKVWHSNDKYRRIVYRCNRKYRKGEEPCGTPAVSENEIKQLFVKALNSLSEEKAATIQNLETLKSMTCNTEEIIHEQDRLAGELSLLTQQIKELVQKNATVAQDQAEYAKKERTLYDLYDEKKARYDELSTKRQERQKLQENIEYFIRALQSLDGQQIEFDEALWGGLVEKMVIQKDGTATVVFKGGIEITVQ